MGKCLTYVASPSSSRISDEISIKNNLLQILAKKITNNIFIYNSEKMF